jgi:hypothetical protein
VNRFTESKPGGINLTVLSVSFYPQAGRTTRRFALVGRGADGMGQLFLLTRIAECNFFA